MSENISLHLHCLLGKAYLSEESFEQLKEGDIVLLEQNLQKPVEILVEGSPIYQGYVGVKKGKKAVQIT